MPPVASSHIEAYVYGYIMWAYVHCSQQSYQRLYGYLPARSPTLASWPNPRAVSESVWQAALARDFNVPSVHRWPQCFG